MPIPPEEFCARRLQLLDACEGLDLRALLVLANGSCFGLSGRSQGYLGFLCGWNSFDSPSALILRRGRAPHLVVVHHRMMKMALETVPDVEVTWIDQDAFGIEIARALGPSAFPDRIGICGWEDVIAKSWKSVESELRNSTLVDITERFVPLRVVKSSAQLQMHADAARTCDEMFALLARLPVVGRFTYDIKAELEYYAKRQGAEFVQHWMSVGTPPDYPRYFPPENRQLPKEGDTLIYGMQIIQDGVWGHAVRCFSVGAATERHRVIQAAAVEFQKRFISLMKPDEEMSEAVCAGFKLRQVVYDTIGPVNVAMLRLGHGLGYSYGEPGVSDAFPRSYYDLDKELTHSVPGRFEPGMIFEIHPIFFYPDGAAGVGDMVEIGVNGASFMTTYPRSIGELRV
jgi:Xaa-Pro aminopeptidase